jgi:hypothetical protein
MQFIEKALAKNLGEGLVMSERQSRVAALKSPRQA